jgi:hypothetical protein
VVSRHRLLTDMPLADYSILVPDIWHTQVHKTFFNNGILRKTKCVAANHKGTQMTQRSNHFTIGYNATGLSNRAIATMIRG